MTTVGLTVAEWTAVASTFFAALAATAAWLSARQGRQSLEAQDRPHLEVQVIAAPPDRMLTLSIINAGRGVARGSSFAVHALGHATDNVIGDGFMPPGQRVQVVTDIGPLPTPAGQMRADLDDLGVMVAYRDARDYVHYRTHAGKEWVPRTLIRRHPEYPDRLDAFRHFFPHIDLDVATRATSTQAETR